MRARSLTVDRQIAIYGRPPRQLAADGGFASTGNLAAAKNKGVEDVAFHKKCGLAITALRNFRAGIEAVSCLKRAYGLGRCTGRGSQVLRLGRRRTTSPCWPAASANPTRPIHQHRRPPIPPACLDHAPLVTDHWTLERIYSPRTHKTRRSNAQPYTKSSRLWMGTRLVRGPMFGACRWLGNPGRVLR